MAFLNTRGWTCSCRVAPWPCVSAGTSQGNAFGAVMNVGDGDNSGDGSDGGDDDDDGNFGDDGNLGDDGILSNNGNLGNLGEDVDHNDDNSDDSNDEEFGIHHLIIIISCHFTTVS